MKNWYKIQFIFRVLSQMFSIFYMTNLYEIQLCINIHHNILKLIFTLEIRIKYNRDFECGGKKYLIFIWNTTCDKC